MTVTKKIDPQEPQRFRWWNKKITFLVGFFLIVLVIIEIWASHTVTTMGEKLQNIERVQRDLQIENQILENVIATHSSITNIASQSASLGLNSPKNVQYIR